VLRAARKVRDQSLDNPFIGWFAAGYRLARAAGPQTDTRNFITSVACYGVRVTKWKPARPSSEKPSAAPEETSIRNAGLPQRSYWSESM